MKFDGLGPIEISPKFTYFGENLANFVAPYSGKTVKTPFII
jgi:hypothetical protein